MLGESRHFSIALLCSRRNWSTEKCCELSNTAKCLMGSLGFCLEVFDSQSYSMSTGKVGKDFYISREKCIALGWAKPQNTTLLRPHGYMMGELVYFTVKFDTITTTTTTSLFFTPLEFTVLKALIDFKSNSGWGCDRLIHGSEEQWNTGTHVRTEQRWAAQRGATSKKQVFG